MSGATGSIRITRSKTLKRKAPSQADNPATSCKKKQAEVSAKMAKKKVPAKLPAQGRGSEVAQDEAAQETENQENSSKTRQRRTLTKVEKLNVVEQVKTYSCETLSVVALTAVGHQLPLNASEELKQFCTSVPVSSLHFLSEQLKKHFIKMYDACSKGADKYLKFQLQWHQHCSYYLVDYNRQLSLIGLHPDDPHCC